MGGRQQGYKGVECQSLEKDDEINTPEKPNNEKLYSVRGFAQRSNSGKALNIGIKFPDGSLHLMSIAKSDIIDAFKYGTKCCVIEYNLTKEQIVKHKQEMKENGKSES